MHLCVRARVCVYKNGALMCYDKTRELCPVVSFVYSSYYLPLLWFCFIYHLLFLFFFKQHQSTYDEKSEPRQNGIYGYGCGEYPPGPASSRWY